jgi:hypothetical protein
MPFHSDRPHVVPERPRQERPQSTHANPFHEPGEVPPAIVEINLSWMTARSRRTHPPRYRDDVCRTVQQSVSSYRMIQVSPLGSSNHDPAACLNSERPSLSEAKS